MVTKSVHIINSPVLILFTSMYMAWKSENVRLTIYAVLSRASAHTRASAYPPLLTVLWFFRVLRVTAHHANSCVANLKVGPLSSHSSDALWTPRNQVRTHLSMAWFAAFLPCSTKFAHCRRRLNALWKLSNEAMSQSAL